MFAAVLDKPLEQSEPGSDDRLFQSFAVVLLGRLLHGQQNGEAKGFTHIVHCRLKSAADPERLGTWMLLANMSSIWLLSDWVGKEVAILFYVGASSLRHPIGVSVHTSILAVLGHLANKSGD